jgi:hypothetical protein
MTFRHQSSRDDVVLCAGCQAGAGHTAAVRRSRGKAIAARKRALKERVTASAADVDPALYREHIWPKPMAVKLPDIMEATGYSKGHCSTQSWHLDPSRLDLARVGVHGRAGLGRSGKHPRIH